jgi:hypothetical protein
MAVSKEFLVGWSWGWGAATEALFRSLEQILRERDASAALSSLKETAANKPVPGRRRGRPPKSESSVQQPRRKRGRPPKKVAQGA